MGHKTHPYGFRLGIIKDWKTHWYANNATGYRNLVLEDLKLRSTVHNEYAGFSDAGISRVEIDRGAQDTVINIHSARPGILIGRDGERVKNLRSKLEGITRRRVQLNIIEIEQPELDPYLVGREHCRPVTAPGGLPEGHAAGGAAGHAGRGPGNQDYCQGPHLRG